MIIVAYDKNEHLIYTYDDYSKTALNVSIVTEKLKTTPLLNGEKFNDHLYIFKEDDTRKYHIFFEDLRNVKEAKYRAKIIVKGIKDYAKIALQQNDLTKYIEDSIFHNTKNIIHYLTNGLKKVINYDELIIQEDKIEYINGLINKNSRKYSKELLAASKSLEQISFEYNIIDYLKPGISIQNPDKTKVKIHSLLVQAFYIYEQEFITKNIIVKISENYSTIKCNFFTLRSAFALIMENCTKYCVDESEIEIDINLISNCLKIDISMKSIYNTDEEITKMFLPKERSEEAKKKYQGSGLGLYIAKHLLNLNNINLYFKRINNNITIKNGIKYSNNMFIIDIPLEAVIENNI